CPVSFATGRTYTTYRDTTKMTITRRLLIIAAILLLVMVPTAIAVVATSLVAQNSFEEMHQYRHVLRTTAKLERSVVDAETAQRAYLLTGSRAYLTEFNIYMAQAKADVAKVAGLKRSSAVVQPERIDAVLRPALAEIEMLERLNVSGTDSALALIRSQEGRFEAQQLRQAGLALDSEQNGNFQRSRRSVSWYLNISQWTAIVGVSLGVLVALFSLYALGRYIRRSLEIILTAMRKADASGIPDDIAAQLAGEFREVRDTYQAMCQRMRNEIIRRDEAESKIGEMLNRSDGELADRRRIGETLAKISHRLPACIDQKELVTLASRFIPQLFDIKGGALYFQNNSSTVLSRVAAWGDCKSSQDEFAPVKCWALRRGQLHVVADTATDVTCGHLTPEAVEDYVCIPLTAQGETVGLLYLEGIAANMEGENPDRAMEDMRVLCENLALALVNLRLRESLRYQSLRDPLTGLHNRRYLEEVLDLEFAKSRRSGAPVSLIMIDIDHFKSINDTLGHDAGDIVLRHLASTIGNSIRKGDVACRYGGEEFVIMMPDLAPDAAYARAELLREQIKATQMRSDNSELPQITASFGLACFIGDDRSPADILRDADHALYQAKAEGRDQVRRAETKSCR
ncbi:MAG TPA: diguanylate cyclase, partial [Novosphingobium sp.]|nr:diguanylate cyclase [Novosphingobium sp.]